MTFAPLAWLAKWVPFRLDALGLVTMLGADEMNMTIGNLVHKGLVKYLPLLSASIINGNRFTSPLAGFTLYNVTDGIMASALAGWSTRWLLAQNLTRNRTTLLMGVRHFSGEAPQVPVASRKSGTIFEKRLIEAYISENGKDPVTNEDLTTEDLIDLKSARIVRPRPPTLTSIPSLLSVFQNEWDALVQETSTLRQHLTQARQELATALYQQDAATRVMARLSRERDEAREALSKITVNGGPATDGDAMQVDGQALSEALVATVDATQQRLSKTRRKRAVPDDWNTAESIQTFTPIETSKPLYPGVRSISLDESYDLVLLGGTEEAAGVFSIKQKQAVRSLPGGIGAVTGTLWAGNKAAIASSTGAVKIFDNEAEVCSFSAHTGEVKALAMHPSGEILASVGVDKSYVFYDLTSSALATQVYTNSSLNAAGFHPDGHLFAAGGVDGQIKLYEVKSGANAANFDASGPIQSLSFSENGTWLAAVVQNQTTIGIWDLRKAAQIKSLDTGSQIECIRWDYTGQFLAIAGPNGLAVQQYSKSSKEWSELLRSAVPAVAAEWGSRAQSLISVNADGVITVLGMR
ncbi:hypothetical protein MMC12_006777 [Toensbergia leucococca]|nr:hypothetical protein [Toensbergia leucococca]